MSSQPLGGRVFSLLPSLASFVRSDVLAGRLSQASGPPLRWNLGRWADGGWPTCSSSSASSSRRGFAADAAPAEASPDDGITLAESAVERLRELQGESDRPVLLRLAVEGGGCSGFQYEFRLESEQKETDRVFERGGARLLVDDVSLDFLRGAVVSYSSDLMRSAFEVAANPNAESSCGCGSSFNAK